MLHLYKEFPFDGLPIYKRKKFYPSIVDFLDPRLRGDDEFGQFLLYVIPVGVNSIPKENIIWWFFFRVFRG